MLDLETGALELIFAVFWSAPVNTFWLLLLENAFSAPEISSKMSIICKQGDYLKQAAPSFNLIDEENDDEELKIL